MTISKTLTKTFLTCKGRLCEMDYDLNRLNKTSIRCLGTISIDLDKRLEFSFFTINDKIAGYTPTSWAKEFISSIVSATLGRELPFEE